jgi:hypothetical protein
MIHTDIAIRLWRRLAFTTAARRTTIADINGDRLTVRATSVGLRIGPSTPD